MANDTLNDDYTQCSNNTVVYTDCYKQMENTMYVKIFPFSQLRLFWKVWIEKATQVRARETTSVYPIQQYIYFNLGVFRFNIQNSWDFH